MHRTAGEPRRGDVDAPKVDVDVPRLDVDPRRLDIDARKVDVDAPRLDVDLRKVDVDAPRVDVDLPKVDVDAPSRSRSMRWTPPSCNGFDEPDWEVSPPVNQKEGVRREDYAHRP